MGKKTVHFIEQSYGCLCSVFIVHKPTFQPMFMGPRSSAFSASSTALISIYLDRSLYHDGTKLTNVSTLLNEVPTVLHFILVV